MDSSEIKAAFDDVFDQALVFHGFRFTCCVRAAVTSALSPEIWKRSLDERLVDYERGRDLDGYVWGVKWQALYPGMKLVPDSVDADRWSHDLGIPFHEAAIETNGHSISLVFADLVVDTVDVGHAPFVVKPEVDSDGEFMP